MIRVLYWFAMYLGLRALFNRIRGVFLPNPEVSIIDGETLVIAGTERIKISVDARPLSKPSETGQKAGMISVYCQTPGIPRMIYTLLRLSSHFGCGHIEIAFIEENGTVTYFAMRNIVKANIQRLRCSGLFCSLKLSSDQDEIHILKAVDELLNARGIDTFFASPEDCVSLAVTKSLLNPKTRCRAMSTLQRKYRRLAQRSAVRVKSLN